MAREPAVQVEVRLEEVVPPADDREHRRAQPRRVGERVDGAPVVVVVRVVEPLAELVVAAALEQRVVGDRQPGRDRGRPADRVRVVGRERGALLGGDVEPGDRLGERHVRPVDVPAELEGAARVDPAVVQVGARAEHRARADLVPSEPRDVERRRGRVGGAVDADAPVAPRLRGDPVEAVLPVRDLVDERVPGRAAAGAAAHLLHDDGVAAAHRLERVEEEDADDERRRPRAADAGEERRERPFALREVDVGREVDPVPGRDGHVPVDRDAVAQRATLYPCASRSHVSAVTPSARSSVFWTRSAWLRGRASMKRT